tara:strand:+ start:148 stop:1824 length:1677 start_codon:yes stop_codon:yes gene_type:complete
MSATSKVTSTKEKTKKKKMRNDPNGQWKTTVKSCRHDLLSTIKEILNNMPKGEINIQYGNIPGRKIQMLKIIETGGGGFGDKGTFMDALTLASSHRKGLNEYGQGLKSPLMIGSERYVYYSDTSIPEIELYPSFNDDEMPDMIEMNEINEPRIAEIMKYKDSRVIIALYGDNIEPIIHKISLDSEIDYKSCPGDICKALNVDYSSKIESGDFSITFNGVSILGEKVIDEDKVGIIGDVRLSDKCKITMYENDTMVQFDFTKMHKGNRSKEFSSEGLIDKRYTKGIRFNSSQVPKGDETDDFEFTIVDYDKDESGGLKDSKIYIKMNGIIIARESFGRDGGWPNLRILIDGTDKDIIETHPNKSRSILRKDVKELIERLVKSHYCKTWSKKEILKEKEEDPPPPEVNDSEQDESSESEEERIVNTPETSSDQEESEESDEDSEEKISKGKIPDELRHNVFVEVSEGSTDSECQCCRGIIKLRFGKTSLGHKYHCGHIKSEKDGGKIEKKNLMPICSVCNQHMQTIHLTEYIIQRFGEESFQYTKYVEMCEKLGKDYKID